MNYSPVEIEEIVEHLQLSIYPNPVSEELYIDGLSIDRAEVYFVDLYGRLIECEQNIAHNSILIPASVSNGIYVLVIKSRSGSISRKIVVRK